MRSTCSTDSQPSRAAARASTYSSARGQREADPFEPASRVTSTSHGITSGPSDQLARCLSPHSAPCPRAWSHTDTSVPTCAIGRAGATELADRARRPSPSRG
eukprot:CAMPEP_0119498880 /NCGR_PEP_ID=MMETSP1344-20130328/21515_1 /TAXON_ID=236787 /ORGANISM="Florenciella parvula, Strain CCMP2471" /LENGTH=101 /DNA_ID=CAMNT_0007534817 /DNA_START=691 /DNA_END=993 /DNA_ORIENTATION=+